MQPACAGKGHELAAAHLTPSMMATRPVAADLNVRSRPPVLPGPVDRRAAQPIGSRGAGLPVPRLVAQCRDAHKAHAAKPGPSPQLHPIRPFKCQKSRQNFFLSR